MKPTEGKLADAQRQPVMTEQEAETIWARTRRQLREDGFDIIDGCVVDITAAALATLKDDEC